METQLVILIHPKILTVLEVTMRDGNKCIQKAQKVLYNLVLEVTMRDGNSVTSVSVVYQPA